MAPTYLYIKQHTATGLKYFGKTVQNPYTYKGSGKYWKKHIKKHGVDKVITCLVLGPYTNESQIEKDALLFSDSMGIVGSKEWANLVNENGLVGQSPGHHFNNGRIHTDQAKQNMRVKKSTTTNMCGKVRSAKHKLNISLSRRGQPGSMSGKNHSDKTKMLISKTKATPVYCDGFIFPTITMAYQKLRTSRIKLYERIQNYPSRYFKLEKV